MSGWSYSPADAKRPVMDPGTYPATVIAATHKLSKEKQLPMCEMVFKVYTDEGERQAWDYLMPGENTTWKIENFANAMGEEDAFAAGTFDPATCVNRNVMVQIVVKKATPGYPESNAIKGYERKPSANAPSAARASVATAPAKVGHTPIGDDDIPFNPFTSGVHPIIG